MIRCNAGGHEIKGQRENNDDMYSQRNKASHSRYHPYNHRKLNRNYFAPNSDNFTSVTSAQRSKRSRNGDEVYDYSDLRSRISKRDIFERNADRHSDRNKDTATRFNKQNEGDRSDLYRTRANGYGEAIRNEGYREESRNYGYRHRDIDDSYRYKVKAIVAENDRERGYRRSDYQYSDKGGISLEEVVDRNDLFCRNNKYDRGRNQEHNDNNRTREERYIEYNRRTCRDYNHNDMLKDQRKSQTRKSETDGWRTLGCVKRAGRRENRDTENHQKAKRHRFRKGDSISLTGSAKLNTDLEDGEYRSPERDVLKQQLVMDEQYDQPESVENYSISDRSCSSYTDSMNIDTETKSNINTGDLSPVSSVSYSGHNFRNADHYEDTLSSPDDRIQNSNRYDGFQNGYVSAQNSWGETNCLPIGETTGYDENEAIVKFQSELFAKKRKTLDEIKDMLQNFTDALHQDIAAEIMPILMEGEAGVTANNVFDKLRAKDNSFDSWSEIKDVIDKKFTTECIAASDDDDLEILIICKPKQSLIKICEYSDIRYSTSYTKCKCDALHICKFFVLSECHKKICRFGHDLRTDHNMYVLKKQLLHRLTVRQLKACIRQKENRNEATIPSVCKFYNREGGCKHERRSENTECTCMHVCKYYIQNECQFGRTCKRSHNLLIGQPLEILKLYGLEETPTEDILALLAKHAVSVENHINLEHNEGDNSLILKEHSKETPNESTLLQKGSFEESIDYIPINRIPKPVRKRYFTTDAFQQKENGKLPENEFTWGQGVSLVQSQNKQRMKINCRVSDTKSATETNILEESGKRSDTGSTITTASESTITTKEELLNDSSVDDDTLSNNLIREYSPAIAYNSKEVGKAVVASNEYTNEHKFRTDDTMVENHIDEYTEHKVQEFLQTMLETIVNGVRHQSAESVNIKNMSALLTLETTNDEAQKEVSVDSRNGMSTTINASPALERTNDDDVFSGNNHGNSEDSKINASPVLEPANRTPRESSDGIHGELPDLKDINVSSALEITNDEPHDDVSCGKNHRDSEDFSVNASPVLETTNDNDEHSRCGLCAILTDFKEINASQAFETKDNELHDDVSSGRERGDLEHVKVNALSVLKTTNGAPQDEHFSDGIHGVLMDLK